MCQSNYRSCRPYIHCKSKLRLHITEIGSSNRNLHFGRSGDNEYILDNDKYECLRLCNHGGEWGVPTCHSCSWSCSLLHEKSLSCFPGNYILLQLPSHMILFFSTDTWE